jgi:chromosomal replication initiator protein
MTRSIIRAVAAHYGMTVETLLSPWRKAPVALARHVAMYLCRKLTDESLPTLGRAFRRDHTSVLHGVQRITALVETDDELADTVDIILGRLKVSHPEAERERAKNAIGRVLDRLRPSDRAAVLEAVRA